MTAAMEVKDSFGNVTLRWLTVSPAWWSQIEKFNNVGAVFDSLRCADVPRFELPIPPIREQEAIASTLGALDDKIDLNRRMNETLEAMARAIFKDWFVDIGPTRVKMEGRAPYLAPEIWALFPDRLTEDSMPGGWSITSLGELASKIGSRATPRGGNAVYVSNGTSLIRSQNVYDHRFVWEGLAHITDDHATRLKGVTVESNDILVHNGGFDFTNLCRRGRRSSRTGEPACSYRACSARRLVKVSSPVFGARKFESVFAWQ
jgi:hypothetical protein